LTALAAELSRQRCDLFFAGGAAANLRALANTAGQTPIVFVAVDFDPVAEGYVASLARPGGRITGVTSLQSELPAKRLELRKELLPLARKAAVLTNEQTTGQLAVAQDAAKRLKLDLHVMDMKRPPFQFEPAFAEAVRAGADSLMVLGSGLWVPMRREIIALTIKSGLPSVFHQAQWAQLGGLLSYGFDFADMWRRGAEMSAKVLRGAKPSEIPFEQPSVYELALNMKTAKALGITVAPTFLTRVNKVIE
jgi:putative ABC transport system substrate-binding protein